MAVSDIEAVIEFLRNNGFSESESALMEDVMEKFQLGSSDFPRFLFPMVPRPPPVKISATVRRLPEVPGGADADDGGCDPPSSRSSDDEEFVSLNSSTTELCSSEFTNPYGIRTTTRSSSQASSDRLSQFGTARDYDEFDMQNDLYWYKEKDEDFAMPPLFGISDFDADPSEDKFVMTAKRGKQRENELSFNHIAERFQSESSINYDDRLWPITTKESGDSEVSKDYNDLERNMQLEEKSKNWKTGCTDYHCSALICACCGRAGENHIEDPADFGILTVKVCDANGDLYRPIEEASVGRDANYSNQNSSMYECVGDFKSIDDFQTHIIKDDHHPGRNGNNEPRDEVMAGATCDPDPTADEEAGTPSDELLMYETKEDDYGIFNLKIVHRKNRIRL